MIHLTSRRGPPAFEACVPTLLLEEGIQWSWDTVDFLSTPRRLITPKASNVSLVSQWITGMLVPAPSSRRRRWHVWKAVNDASWKHWTKYFKLLLLFSHYEGWAGPQPRLWFAYNGYSM